MISESREMLIIAGPTRPRAAGLSAKKTKRFPAFFSERPAAVAALNKSLPVKVLPHAQVHVASCGNAAEGILLTLG